MTMRRLRHLPLPLIVAAALVAGGALAGCGGSSSGDGGSSAEGKPKFSGLVASQSVAPAPLELRNYDGKPVDLREFEGKAVLVTFIYTHCPDVCPLIVSHMKTAQALLGPRAKDLQILAVSTDPRGDTPKTVAAFLRAHGMAGRMDYLIGSQAELGRVWKQWNIVAKPDKANPDLVEHSAEIYGISAGGKLTTLYPANFKPQQLVHDVPLLAQE
jgi:protein SCO1/2